MSLSKLFLNSSLRYSLNTFNCLNEIKLPIRNVFTKQQNISNLNRIQLANFSNSNILKSIIILTIE